MGSFAYLERWGLWAGGRFAHYYLCRRLVFRSLARAGAPANRRHRAKAQRSVLASLACILLLFGCVRIARADKLSTDERIEIERGLTAEFATAKVILPHSKKPLVIHSDGQYDKSAWEQALREGGPAARLGDELQITRVQIESNKILLEINGGGKNGHWYDHVEIGMGGTTSPVSTNQNGQGTNGSRVELLFPGSVPSVKSAEIRRMLSPIFDFEKHSASEQYVDKLPAPVKKAIKEQRAIKGMDKDQVMLALGRPRNKSRETNQDGDEIENWVYGDPPGKMTFVKFNEGKVVEVDDSYANIGGTTAPPLPSPR
jgi:hypothetical protein